MAYTKQTKMSFVYSLTDPRNNKIRYVGISINPEKRFQQHLSMTSGSIKKKEWLKELKSLELKPILTVIEPITQDNALEREEYWINFHKKTVFNNVPKEIKILLDPESPAYDKFASFCQNNKINYNEGILKLIQERNSNIEIGTLEYIQDLVLLDRLEKFSGNRIKTAESLGVSVRWIQLRIKAYKTIIF